MFCMQGSQGYLKGAHNTRLQSLLTGVALLMFAGLTLFRLRDKFPEANYAGVRMGC